MKAIPIKEVSSPKIAKKLLRLDMHGRLSSPGKLYNRCQREIPAFQCPSRATVPCSGLCPAGWWVLLSSHPSACPTGLCPRVFALMYSPISDLDVHPSCVMRPSYASWACNEVLSLCAISFGCVMETESPLLIAVHFATVFCHHNWWLWIWWDRP